LPYQLRDWISIARNRNRIGTSARNGEAKGSNDYSTRPDAQNGPERRDQTSRCSREKMSRDVLVSKAHSSIHRFYKKLTIPREVTWITCACNFLAWINAFCARKN
jgi:hypothetical protein